MKKAKLNTIRIRSTDPKAQADWYMENFGIGLHTPGFNQGWEIIDPENEKDYQKLAYVDGNHPEFDNHDKDVTLSITVDDLDQILEDLKSEGIEAIAPVKKYDYGRYTYIIDPDGYKIELYEPNDSANMEMSNPTEDS